MIFGRNRSRRPDLVFENIFEDVDLDSSGQIDFEEFLRFVQMAGDGRIAGLSPEFNVKIDDMGAAKYKKIFGHLCNEPSQIIGPESVDLS